MPITVTAHKMNPPLPLKRIEKAAGLFLSHLGVRDVELSIVLLTGPAMRKLNRESLGHDYVTDVVTFDLSDKTLDTRHLTLEGTGRKKILLKRDPQSHHPVSRIDGEICICPAEARRNARRHGESFERELLRYVAHGILHLCGMDDHSVRARAQMSAAENECLAQLGSQGNSATVDGVVGL